MNTTLRPASKPTRRQALLALPLLPGLCMATAAEQALPEPESLATALRAAVAQKRALVVLASLAGCPYCKIVRENYLLGVLAAGQPVVQINFRSEKPVLDFDGAASTHSAFLRTMHIDAAPTVLFVGPGGREVAERLRGFASADFYGAYLSLRLDQSRAALRA